MTEGAAALKFLFDCSTLAPINKEMHLKCEYANDLLAGMVAPKKRAEDSYCTPSGEAVSMEAEDDG